MIADNLTTIQSRYGTADPTLVAVSKNQPDHKIDETLACGLRIFGENKVQEATNRWEGRKQLYPDLRLHLIGPLQTNKVKDAARLFDVIHTLDREKLAKEIVKYAPEIPCFIQVNTGGEPQKAGISPDNLSNFHDLCIHDLGMNIIGLMCIPPIHDTPEEHFLMLKNAAHKLELPHLSMGMSNDFETAIKCGATHIRVGTALFGNR